MYTIMMHNSTELVK